ncbi:MAG: DNA-3-methyladenine glycosylase [Chloroflexota bacterium]
METEAYCDFRVPDLACHGSRNKGRPTKRTAVMFGPAGFAYVYLNYGIHWLFNVVTGASGIPSAVLIRGLEPIDGLDQMGLRRPKATYKNWTNGPGKLTQAVGINQSHDGQNLCASNSVIWIEDAADIELEQICCGPRIGLGKTPEPWHSMPWRFWLKDNQFVSV